MAVLPVTLSTSRLALFAGGSAEHAAISFVTNNLSFGSQGFGRHPVEVEPDKTKTTRDANYLKYWAQLRRVSNIDRNLGETCEVTT